MSVFNCFECARYFWMQMVDPSSLASTLAQQRKTSFLLHVQSYMSICNFMKRAVRKIESGIAHIAFSGRPLQKQRDRTDRDGGVRGVCGLWDRGRARGHGDRASRLKYEGAPNSCPSIDYGRCFAPGFMAPEIDAPIDAPLAEMALRRDLLATEYSA